MGHSLALSLSLLLVASSALAQTSTVQSQPAPTFAAFLQAQYASLKRYIIASAEKMPVEHFAFKPAPEVMSYAGLLAHIIDVQYGFCSSVLGGPNPAAAKGLAKLTDKEALVPAIKEAFTYCDDVFAALTNENAMDILTVGSGANEWQTARASSLTRVIVHGNEHYGNLVTYMRIHGIVPPSSAPQ